MVLLHVKFGGGGGGDDEVKVNRNLAKARQINLLAYA